MRLPKGFEEFARRTSPWLSRTAYLLTGDAVRAEDLLRTVLARVLRAWWRVRRAPEPYAHRILIRAYAAWWRRERRSGPEAAPHETEDVHVHVLRMVAVGDEARAGRQRRVLTVVACLLLVGAAVTTMKLYRGGEPGVGVPVVPSAPNREGEYRDGTRIVAKGVASAPGPVTIRYRPRFGLPEVFTECVLGKGHPPGYRAAVAVNGVPAFETPCGGLPSETADWRGLVAGGEALVTVTVFPEPQVPGVAPPSMPPGLEVRVSIGEPVPVDDYPLPPPPPQLWSVEGQVALEDGEVLLRSDPTGPSRVQQVTAVLPERGTYRFVTNAPGRVLIDFGGVARTVGSWTYDGYVSAHTVPLAGGEITVTVRPENHHGDWALLLMR
ncbi:sigma factor [Actinosynnema sp. CA-299493]